MTNKEVARFLFEQAHSAKINKLIWIAADTGSSGALRDTLDEIQGKEFRALFPLIRDKDIVGADTDEVIQLLSNYSYLGFLAEIYIPVCYNFKYKKGEAHPFAWSSSDGHCTIYWVYAETTDELAEKIKVEADVHFAGCIERDKKQPAKK